MATWRPSGSEIKAIKKAASREGRVSAGAVFLALLLLAPLPATADTVAGRVVGVMDGDTLMVLTAERDQRKIRLAEIDAPERGQAFGESSKQALSGLCYRRMATIEVVDTDRYGRLVGRVQCDGVNANHAQVEAGMAWVYRKYLHDPSLLPKEKLARNAGRGLWGDPGPVPPWEFRRAKNN